MLIAFSCFLAAIGDPQTLLQRESLCVFMGRALASFYAMMGTIGKEIQDCRKENDEGDLDCRWRLALGGE